MVNSAAFTLFVCLSIQFFSVKMSQDSQCIPDIVYMCGTPEIDATADKVALVAPGRPPSCVQEAANCSTLITARPGEKIAVTLNTGISISPCDDSNYVQFSGGTEGSKRYCQELPPPVGATTTATSRFGHLFTSSTNSMSVTYRSRSEGNFISVYVQAVGCPHADLIEGSNHQIQEEAFSRNYLYTINVSCDPGYLLSNATASISATCRYIASTQTYKWSISSRYQCHGVLCSTPLVLPNGWFTPTVSSYTYLTSVTYACNTGYHLNGTRTRQCITENGIGATWSGAAPSCTAVDCGTPSIQNANFSSPTNTSYGTEFLYTCNSSYVPTGLQTARCMENARWSYASCEDFYSRGADVSHSSQLSYTTIAAPVGGVIAIIIISAIVAAVVIMKRKKANRIPKVQGTSSLDSFISATATGYSSTGTDSEGGIPKGLHHVEIFETQTTAEQTNVPVAESQEVELIDNDLYSTSRGG